MSDLAKAANHIAVVVTDKLVSRSVRERLQTSAHRAVRTVTTSAESTDFVESLDGTETDAVRRYLTSLDFEEVAQQLALWRLLRNRDAENVEPDLRQAVYLGLRHSGSWTQDRLARAANVVFDELRIAVQARLASLHPGDADQVTAVEAAHLASAAVSNNRLLARVESLAAFHVFAQRLRAQVRARHAEMRLPHLGISRSVSYDRLYVEPLLGDLEDITLPGRRSVVLGDPGAGKSTLAAKLAWEIASAEDGRVPFLLVLRNFTSALRTGGMSLTSYLEAVCREPYNLAPPPDSVEYLLRNGRTVVLLDGVDELVDPEVRQRFARLVESFADLYPLVPIVVTARKIGYEIAPLNPKAFRTGIIEEFDHTRVERYVRLWFVLDSSTPPTERPRLAQSFLRESRALGELRKNPLMLALLCAMYSSEHYLPTNLAQAYEKCALMMFDQWDRMRGLPMPTRFESHLRGAVGYLAWRQLNAENSGTAWPRGRIVAMLTEYLERRDFDTETAEDNANKFVDFCTGRPWVLTDTGTDRAEPRYGFTHRTFLEFFAADHLVRTNRTAEPLWAALRPMLLNGSGGVVPQIALQLYDQKHEDGASELLRLVAAEGNFISAWFGASSLRYTQPNPQVVRAVVRSAVRIAASHRVEDRFHYWLPWHVEHYHARDDEPLDLLVNSSSHANRPIVLKSLDSELATGGYDEDVAKWLKHYWFGAQDPSTPPLPWASVLNGAGDLRDLVEEFGPQVLYLSLWTPRETGRSLAWQALMGYSVHLDPEVLLRAPLPWVDGTRWWGQRRLAREQPHMMAKDVDLRHALLTLPYLESEVVIGAHPRAGRHWGHELSEARRTRGPADLRHLQLPKITQEFLESWCRGDFSVIGPATEERRRRALSG